jgi:hypothetical protein
VGFHDDGQAGSLAWMLEGFGVTPSDKIIGSLAYFLGCATIASEEQVSGTFRSIPA